MYVMVFFTDFNIYYGYERTTLFKVWLLLIPVAIGIMIDTGRLHTVYTKIRSTSTLHLHVYIQVCDQFSNQGIKLNFISPILPPREIHIKCVVREAMASVLIFNSSVPDT